MNSTLLGAVSVGRVINGRFPLLRQLGGSESTSAYLTELDDGSPKKAAIKIFPFESVDPRATIAQWDIARTLSHPHLMPLFHAARIDVDGEDLLYVVTEYADETLSQILPQRPLTTEEARELLGPILDALSYLHKRCLTHGHLRPTNIMVVDEHLKLSPDFGWRARKRSIYDPPEAGIGRLDPPADVWALGILLVEALTQQPPAWNKSQSDLPEIPATIPEPFFTIARACLQVDPAQRCTLADIQEHLAPPPAAEPCIEHAQQPIGPAATPSYKSRAIAIGGALLVMLLIIATFKFGYDFAPSSTTTASQTPPPAPSPAQPEPSLTKPVADPAPITAKVLPPPVAPTPIATQAPAPTPIPVIDPANEVAIKQSAPAESAPQEATTDSSVTHQALPAIPADIINTIRGRVKVGIRVEVNAQGNVAQASIDSPGPSRYFATQSLHAAQNWKFKPAQADDPTAPRTWLLQFQYDPSGVSATPSEVTQ